MISRGSISESEHDGRLSLLKQLLYLSKVYDWQTILKLYTEVVSKIKKCLLTYDSPFDVTITCALPRFGPGRSVSSAQKVSNFKTRPIFKGILVRSLMISTGV